MSFSVPSAGPVLPQSSYAPSATLSAEAESAIAGRAPGALDRATPAGCHVLVLTEPDEIRDLRPAWEALWQAADGGYTQAYATCAAAWLHMANPEGARLRVMACFDDGRLVALWPLVSHRVACWRVLSQLGPQAAEYSDILIEPSRHAAMYAAAIWHAVRTQARGDIIVLPFVKANSPLRAVLDHTSNVVAEFSTIAPYVAWRVHESWDEYYDTLNRKHRKEQARKRRHLHAQGEVRFEAVTDPGRLTELIDWMLPEKRIWADRAGKNGAWLRDERYRRFLASAATDAGSNATYVMFRLTLDGETVAAKLAMAGTRHMDGIIAGFSHHHARYAPGVVLDEYCQAYAHARGLDIDLGTGAETGKLFWSRGEARAVTTYRVALTPWGAFGARLRNLRESALRRKPG